MTLANSMLGHVVSLATNAHGSRMLQEVISKCMPQQFANYARDAGSVESISEDLECEILMGKIVAEMKGRVMNMVENEHANYVISALMHQCCNASYTAALIDELVPVGDSSLGISLMLLYKFTHQGWQ